MSWDAILDVRTPKNLDVVMWILRRLDRGQSLTRTDLIREVGIKSAIAVAVLQRKRSRGPGWVEWAEHVTDKGKPNDTTEALTSSVFSKALETFREIKGKGLDMAEVEKGEEHEPVQPS